MLRFSKSSFTVLTFFVRLPPVDVAVLSQYLELGYFARARWSKSENVILHSQKKK